jgi:hypothetical protein
VVERIGQRGACPDHSAAIASIVDKLTKGKSRVISSISEIGGMGTE